LISNLIGSIEYLKILILFPTFLIIAYAITIDKKLINIFCDYLTNFSIIALGMMLVGVIYAAIGGASLLEFSNPDGRLNLLYLTTLANEGGINGSTIRPSFIYDEPGAISFVLWICIALREVLGRDKKLNWLIAILGLITLSITHILLLIIYLIFKFKIKKCIFIFIFIFLSVLSIGVFQNKNLEFASNRFDLSTDYIVENNRSLQVANFLNIVNPDIIIFGAYKCFESLDKKCEEHGDITSSPVTPIYYGGIILFIIQFTSLNYLLFIFIKDKKYRISALILFVLLMQRPYFNTIGYGLLIYILIIEIYNSRNIKLI
jgi:hypothetical protein